MTGLRVAPLLDLPALFDLPRPEDQRWIDASLEQLGQIERALARLGHAPRRLADEGDARRLVAALAADRPDLEEEVGVVVAAERSGRSFDRTIGDVVAAALARRAALPAGMIARC